MCSLVVRFPPARSRYVFSTVETLLNCPLSAQSVSGSEEEINAVEGAPLLSGLVPPPAPLGFPQGIQHSPGKGRTHRNLSLMTAIININGEDTSDQRRLSSHAPDTNMSGPSHRPVYIAGH